MYKLKQLRQEQFYQTKMYEKQKQKKSQNLGVELQEGYTRSPYQGGEDPHPLSCPEQALGKPKPTNLSLTHSHNKYRV